MEYRNLDKILIIEDYIALANLVKDYLQKKNIQ
jgi:DNA-binding response OmpR family regulator